MHTTQPTTPRAFALGERVSYYQVGTGRNGAGGGWRFGRIIGLHCDDLGINASGVDMATVRFPEMNRELPACDQALPLFRLVREGGAA